MGKIFLLAFLILTALFFVRHARADGYGDSSGPDSVRATTLTRAGTLVQNPEPEKGMAGPPSAKEPPSSAAKCDGDDGERASAAEAPEESESRKMGRHHSTDKSVAGGGVIIGGLVTAIFAVVYCYIRVTRRRHDENFHF